MQAKIVELKKQGVGSRKIGKLLGVGKSTVNDTYNRLLERTLNAPKESTKPRILLIDLETSPSVVATFGRWQQNIGNDSVIREGGVILSACYKFLGDVEVTKLVLTPAEAQADDDLRILCHLHEVLESADAVVAHNLKRFDFPVLKTRMLLQGLPPPHTPKLTDTLTIAKRLKFNSNKLDSLGKYLGVGEKLKHEGIKLWIKCINGDYDALGQMLEYNAQDVELLEAVYLKLRAWDNAPFNAGHLGDSDRWHRHVCPVCSSSNVEYTGGTVYAAVSEYHEVICLDCGARSRSRHNLSTKEKRKNLLASI
jgi:transposase-like protein